MKHRIFLLLLPLFTLLSAQPASAQTALYLQKPVNKAPYRYVSFTALCKGIPVTHIDPSSLEVREADTLVSDLLIIPPDTSIAYRQRFCVLVDVNPDVSAELLDTVRVALHALIDTLRPGDEVEICWYGRGVGVEQAMSADTALLHRAVTSLPSVAPSAGSALGLFDERVRAHPVEALRPLGVLVFNGSEDTAGEAYTEERRAFCDSAGIRVYALFHVRYPSTWQFASLATSTRGMYTWMAPGWRLRVDALAAYRLQLLCHPGTYTTLRLPMKRYSCDRWIPDIYIIWTGCDTIIRKWEDVPDWMDSSGVTGVRFSTSSATGYGGCLVNVTLRAEQESATPLRIGAEQISVRYDTTHLRLVSYSTAGTLLERFGQIAWPFSDAEGFSITYDIRDTALYDGLILHCTFLVAETGTSRHDTIRIENIGLSNRCYIPSSVDGIIDVRPRAQAPPVRFSFPARTDVSGTEAVLPVSVAAADSSALDFTMTSLQVCFGAAKTECLGIEFRPGVLFEDGKVTYSPGRGGGVLSFAPGCRVTRNGILAWLRFRTVVPQDSSAQTVSPGDVVLAEGCVYPETEKGVIRFNLGSTGIDETLASADPVGAVQIAPAPALHRALLRFTLLRDARVRIACVSLLGQELGVVAQGSFASGAHHVPIERPGAGGSLMFLCIAVDGNIVRTVPVLWEQ
jgi:hypothetical protein